VEAEMGMVVVPVMMVGAGALETHKLLLAVRERLDEDFARHTKCVVEVKMGVVSVRLGTLTQLDAAGVSAFRASGE